MYVLCICCQNILCSSTFQIHWFNDCRPGFFFPGSSLSFVDVFRVWYSCVDLQLWAYDIAFKYNNDLGSLRFWQDFRFVNLTSNISTKRLLSVSQPTSATFRGRYSLQVVIRLFPLGGEWKKKVRFTLIEVLFLISHCYSSKRHNFVFTFPLIAYCGRVKGISV